MTRIRTIKPSFFQSDDVSALPLRARLTWIGLWTHCDDAGRAKDHVRLIKAAIWPLDNVSLADIEEDLTVLAEHGRIARYVVGDQHYLEITNWSEHQYIQKKTPSRLPPPTEGLPVVSRNGTRPLPEDDGRATAGKGREGKGREGTRAREADPITAATAAPGQEPPPQCEEHLGNPNPPKCGPCADARRLHETWAADKRSRIAAAAKCRVHRGQLADNCALCRAEELNPA